MSSQKIPVKEARVYIENVSRRIALLHLAYARTIVDELGEEEGLELIAKAIRLYGKLIGEEVRKRVVNKGLEPTVENWSHGEDIPSFGMHEKIEYTTVGNELRVRAYGCVLAKVWREYGEERLGRMYCYVDPVKYITYDPNYKLVHLKTMPDGYEYCEFVVSQSSYEDKKILDVDKNVYNLLVEVDKP